MRLPYLGKGKQWAMKATGKLMGQPTLFKLASKTANAFLKNAPRSLIYNPLNTWGIERDLPKPSQTFDEWYKKQQ